MPTRPLRPCSQPGCPTLVAYGRCAQHRQQESRGTALDRGYDYQWQRSSKAFLREHPLCHYCKLRGLTVAAGCVDHATPHRGDRTLFWDRRNWRAACIACNSSKGDRDESTFLRFISSH
ncbi:MAG: HNH endonuclease [Gemmatimonadota bacterium]